MIFRPQIWPSPLTALGMDPGQKDLHRWRGMQHLCQHACCLVCALRAGRLSGAQCPSCSLQFQDYWQYGFEEWPSFSPSSRETRTLNLSTNCVDKHNLNVKTDVDTLTFLDLLPLRFLLLNPVVAPLPFAEDVLLLPTLRRFTVHQITSHSSSQEHNDSVNVNLTFDFVMCFFPGALTYQSCVCGLVGHEVLSPVYTQPCWAQLPQHLSCHPAMWTEWDMWEPTGKTKCCITPLVHYLTHTRCSLMQEFQTPVN